MEEFNLELKMAWDYLQAMINAGKANKEDCQNVQMHLDNINNIVKKLIIPLVSKCRRVEFTNDTFLKEGTYEVETNLGRKFEAMYSLNRWFEHKIDIQDGEKVVAYFC